MFIFQIYHIFQDGLHNRIMHPQALEQTLYLKGLIIFTLASRSLVIFAAALRYPPMRFFSKLSQYQSQICYLKHQKEYFEKNEFHLQLIHQTSLQTFPGCCHPL